MIDVSTAAKELSAKAVAAKKQRRLDIIARLDSIEKKLDAILAAAQEQPVKKS